MAQTDSISYIPLLFWYIILFIILYILVFTEILYIILVTFKIRYQTYINFILNYKKLSNSILEILDILFSFIIKIKNLVLLYYLFNLISMNMKRFIYIV